MKIFRRATPKRDPSYHELRSGLMLTRLLRDGTIEKYAILGGEKYAIQVQHPDGEWLRIGWDGSIDPLKGDTAE